MPTNHMTEEQTYGGAGFQPFDFDETVEPDLADGQYVLEISDVKFRMSNPDKQTGVAYPQLVLEWKAISTEEEDERCQKSIGGRSSEFLTFRPKGDRSGNMTKQRLTLLRNRFGIDTDVLPSTISSPADFDPLKEALKGQQTAAQIVNKPDKTGTLRTNIQILTDAEGTVEEEAPPPRATAKAPAKASKAAPKTTPRRR